MKHFSRLVGAMIAMTFVACSSDPGNDTGTVDLSSCTAANTIPVALDVGQYRIINPLQQSNCVSLPGSASAQEYVVVAFSGDGASTGAGNSAAYALQSALPGTAGLSADFATASLAAAPGRSNTGRFEQNLRALERTLVRAPRTGGRLVMPSAPPILGQKDSFDVCATTSCNTFTKVGATVKYAGNPGVIYLDDRVVAGAEQFTDSDLQSLGQLFDNYLYAADTTAFGRESDINQDGRIAILMTPAVNALTPDCSDGRVVGYTYGADLIPSARGSNARELFYTLSTSVATATCKAVSRTQALNALPTTLIHELQHMISFNQHVILRGGYDQDTWMNEGLSHFAEELGWRVVPPSLCGGDCFTRYVGGNIGNAYDYLNDPEAQYLVAPESSDGTLPERGAAWLFIRWVVDHFSADSVLGTQFTRGMEESNVLGATRVAQLTGTDFPTLVGRWQLANWTSNLPGFATPEMLRYRTWNFRSVFAANYGTVFTKVFPLTPDSTAGAYSHTGTLRAGSGRTARYALAAGSPGATIRIAGSRTNGPLSTTILPNLAIVRIK